MRIFGGLQRNRGSYDLNSREGQRLAKSDLIGDLFNNRSAGVDGHDVKVRLSRTSRRLSQQLHEKVEDFLSTHDEISEELSRVPLDEDGELSTKSRQLAAYLRWLEIRRGNFEEEAVSEGEQPYLKIHRLGKDEEMRSIYHEFHESRLQHQEARRRNAPNYYYLAYPETYAFN